MSTHLPAARLAVDVVNARLEGCLDTAWIDALLSRSELPIRHGLRDDEARSELLEAMTALADDAVGVFAADDHAGAARLLNALLEPLEVRVSVSISDAYAPHLHFDARHDSAGARLRVNCLLALATLLADPSSQHRLGTCASQNCSRVFVDTSRSARQRFCSRRCATRSHVSDHRSRRSSGAR